MSVGALAYDTVPLSSASKLGIFSPEFQSLVTDKGGMILHMLRWVEGDQKYDETMRAFASQYAGKPPAWMTSAQLPKRITATISPGFFPNGSIQPALLNSKPNTPCTGSEINARPRIICPGFRVVGQIAQDLDLFRMPVELKIDTDGKTEEKRIDVVGTDSPFSVETFGKPRRISIDPDNRVLKNSTDVKLRAYIQRGQALVQQGDFAGALSEFNKALDINKNSSLAHYRIADVFFSSTTIRRPPMHIANL